MRTDPPSENVICDSLRCQRVVLEQEAITIVTSKYVEDDGSPGTFHFCCEPCFQESDELIRTGRYCVPLERSRRSKLTTVA
jgi:hypothetical protein